MPEATIEPDLASSLSSLQNTFYKAVPDFDAQFNNRKGAHYVARAKTSTLLGDPILDVLHEFRSDPSSTDDHA